MRAAAHDRAVRQVIIAAAIGPLVIAVILLCAVLGAGCATITKPIPGSPSCAQDPSGPTCPPPIGDRKG